MTKKISIIGGAGFIGTYLCGLLHQRGQDFEIIDLKPSPVYPDKTKIVDICEQSALSAAITGDVIVHLAAVHRDDVKDKTLYDKVNEAGTDNICKVATQQGIRKIIFTSSVAVYGFAPEDTDESGAINPFNDYGRTKAAAETVLQAWQKTAKEHSLIIVRPTVVFGEGNRGNVFNLLNQIASGRFLMIGRGHNKKSMAYVGNVAAFLLHAIDATVANGLYNYIDKPDLDMNALVSHVRSVLTGQASVGLRLPYWFGLLLGYSANIVGFLISKRLAVSAIRVKKFCAVTSFSSNNTLAGFIAPFSLQAGLEKTLDSEFINPDPERPIFFTE